MRQEITLFFTFISFLSISYLYISFAYNYEVTEDHCYIIKKNNNCKLVLVSRKECMSDYFIDYKCEGHKNMDIIPCLKKRQKNIDLCKLYLNFIDLRNDFEGYDTHI